jgi:phosphoribosylglycinamide formyltransferase-1
MLRVGWFSSGKDTEARDLLAEVLRLQDEGDVDVLISFVFCNREEDEDAGRPEQEERGRFFSLVRSHDLPLITLSWKRMRASMRGDGREGWRAAYGTTLRSLLADHPFEVGVVAGYGPPMDDETCRHFTLLTVSPSLRGSEGGRDESVWKVIAARAHEFGAIVRVCAPDSTDNRALSLCSFSLRSTEFVRLWQDMDEGLGRRSVDLLDKAEIEGLPLFRRIKEEEARREPQLVARTLALLAAGTLRVDRGKIYDRDRPLSAPYDLSAAVDEALRTG